MTSSKDLSVDTKIKITVKSKICEGYEGSEASIWEAYRSEENIPH
jgi:hypothetical protein